MCLLTTQKTAIRGFVQVYGNNLSCFTLVIISEDNGWLNGLWQNRPEVFILILYLTDRDEESVKKHKQSRSDGWFGGWEKKKCVRMCVKERQSTEPLYRQWEDPVQTQLDIYSGNYWHAFKGVWERPGRVGERCRRLMCRIITRFLVVFYVCVFLSVFVCLWKTTQASRLCTQHELSWHHCSLMKTRSRIMNCILRFITHFWIMLTFYFFTYFSIFHFQNNSKHQMINHVNYASDNAFLVIVTLTL